MLHTNTAQNSTLNSGNPETPISLFLNLPQEIHFKLGALLDPKTLSNIIQTCRQCKIDYDTTINFLPFLKPEYQQQVPKQLFKEMFAFEARKKYNIRFEHSKRFLKGDPLKYLLIHDIVDKKDVPFFSESEVINFCCRFQDPNICRLIELNLLSINETKNLSNTFLEKFFKNNLYQLFSKSKLSLKDIEHLTNNQFERLREYNIYKLFIKERLSLHDIDNLTANQFEKLRRDNISKLFERNKLLLETIENLTNDQFEKLRINYIAYWIESDSLSLKDLENISIDQTKTLCSTIRFMLVNKLISKTDIVCLTKSQIDRLCKFNISKLLMKKYLSFAEFKSLSNKQTDRLSNYNIYWLFKRKVLSLQNIENLSDEQLVNLRKQTFLHLLTTRSTVYWNSLWTNLKDQSRRKM